jgi:hypothetical protein
MKKIVFNGREYASLAEMPPEVRRAFDTTTAGLGAADREKLRAALGGRAAGAGTDEPSPGTTTRVVVNGREYDDPADMPPAVRAAYHQMLRRASAREASGFSGPGPTGQSVTGPAGPSGPSEHHVRVVVTDLTSGGSGSGRVWWYVLGAVLVVLLGYLVLGG